jgi:hypothetical protein
MSTVYDRPCPEPTEEEEDIFSQDVLPHFMDEMVRRFGRVRAEVILDYRHVLEIADDLTNGFEQDKRRRILSDLNEEIRGEQYISHMEWHGDAGDAKDFRPWLLVPTRES